MGKNIFGEMDEKLKKYSIRDRNKMEEGER